MAGKLLQKVVSCPWNCVQGLYANFSGVLCGCSGHPSRDTTPAFPGRRHCSRRHVLMSLLLVFIVPFLYIQLTFPVRYMFKNTDVHSSCHIPTTDPYDPSILKFVWKPEPLVCDSTPSLIYVDTSGLVQFNTSSLHHLSEDVSSITCEYRILDRHIDDDHVIFHQAVKFTPPFRINSDFFRINCRKNKQQTVFDRLLTNTVSVTSTTGKDVKAESRKHMSVILFGLDSVSRSAAIRKLPKTYRYLTENLGAYDFKGYMKVGENTLPNLTPLLTGRRIWTDEVPITDYKTDNFDTLPFIWKNISDNYATFHAEDVPEFATFNYLTKGFKNPPADHYMRPFWLGQTLNKVDHNLDKVFLYLESKKFNVRKSSALCYGDKPKHQIQIDYLKQFLGAYRGKRRFAFSFITELTHEVPNFLEYGDEDFLELFQWLKEKGHLQNTVLVFFSDHGARIDKIRNTFIGRIEERMPLMTIAIPNYLKSEYPDVARNMKINTNRLATPFDVHQTIVDVLNSNFRSPSVSYINNVLRSISLFQPLPEDRSCADAWIPENYCACYKSTPVNVSTNSLVRNAAMLIVNYLNNELLSQQPKCSQLQLLKIQEAYSIKLGLKHEGTENKGISLFQFFKPEVSANRRYFVIIETTPGHGVFEATYDFNPHDGLNLVGDIVRANKYGNQPHCITQKQIRPYCFCTDLL